MIVYVVYWVPVYYAKLSHVDINPSRQTQAVYFVRGYTAPSAIHQVWLKCLQLDIQHKPFPLGMDNHFVLAIFGDSWIVSIKKNIWKLKMVKVQFRGKSVTTVSPACPTY